MPRFCPLCPSNDGIDASHNQACTEIAKLARFECDLLHIAELFSSPPCSLFPAPVQRPGRGPSSERPATWKLLTAVIASSTGEAFQSLPPARACKIAALDAAQRKSIVHQLCKSLARSRVLRNNRPRMGERWARAMSQSAGFDFDRYRRLLAEADDEPKRLAFINLLVDEKAKDKLAGESLRGRLAELGLKAKK
jgi:hypothetical protein